MRSPKQQAAISRALETVGEHCRMSGHQRIGVRREEIETRFTELLIDLRHAAAALDLPIEACIANSRRHYLDQLAAEQPQATAEENVTDYDESFEGCRH